MVEAFFLPEAAGMTLQLVDLASAELLPGKALSLDLRCPDQSDKQVDVIGHDHKISQVVSSTVKVLQALGNNLGARATSEYARAVTFVETVEVLAGKRVVVFAEQRFGESFKPLGPTGLNGTNAVSFEPILASTMPKISHTLGNGIFSAKRDEVGCSCLKPVWQVPTVNLQVAIRIEQLKHAEVSLVAGTLRVPSVF